MLSVRLLAPPDQLPGLLVQGDEIALLAAWYEDHLVAIHQGHSAKAPLRQRRVEIFRVVLAQISAPVAASAHSTSPYWRDGNHPIVVDGRRAARSGKTAPARCA